LADPEGISPGINGANAAQPPSSDTTPAMNIHFNIAKLNDHSP
jgi:hypothetical protein